MLDAKLMRVLELLTDSKEHYMSSMELAQKCDVSKRTVQTRIQELRNSLESTGATIEAKQHAAVDEQAALDALETFAQNWDNKYPKISKSWRENWADLSTYFKYPQEVRRLIYTTNTIEGFNRQLRKVTKSKSVFPTDDSLLKMLYLAMMDITKKWTGRRQDWSRIHAQLSIYFAERMPD